MARARRRILAVSSGGGHWVQLNRVIPAFEGHQLAFVTVDPAYRSDVGAHRFYTVRDATRWSRVGLLIMALQLLWILVRERPDVVIVPATFLSHGGRDLLGRCYLEVERELKTELRLLPCRRIAI